ncbi:uncharacterized protein METZ01_LOCUS516885 [marine metagenome]|uniref:Uncharacterized protein n=1 Tax=marine metagenome TaxID=408172 RepID=A0A383F4X0_9ZZZZ
MYSETSRMFGKGVKENQLGSEKKSPLDHQSSLRANKAKTGLALYPDNHSNNNLIPNQELFHYCPRQ